ncbi:MAG: molybdopterin-binding protein [Rhodospirillaceae bacterium]
MTDTPTACLIIIGDEILSGRTQDANLKFIGERMAAMGIRLLEARVVPDIPDAIVEAINTCRARYSYVFTTGGIGPTHDDITTACVARAFRRDIVREPGAVKKLTDYYGDRINDARLKMTEIPDGPDVELIDNRVTAAPGYRIENVFVLAGIPNIAQAMFDAIAPKLKGGAPMRSGNVDAFVRESDIASELSAIQTKYPQVAIGSYPSIRNDKFCTSVVARSTDTKSIKDVMGEVADAMRAKGGEPIEGPLI